MKKKSIFIIIFTIICSFIAFIYFNKESQSVELTEISGGYIIYPIYLYKTDFFKEGDIYQTKFYKPININDLTTMHMNDISENFLLSIEDSFDFNNNEVILIDVILDNNSKDTLVQFNYLTESKVRLTLMIYPVKHNPIEYSRFKEEDGWIIDNLDGGNKILSFSPSRITGSTSNIFKSYFYNQEMNQILTTGAVKNSIITYNNGVLYYLGYSLPGDSSNQSYLKIKKLLNELFKEG